MEFALSQDQEELLATVRAVLAKRSDPAAVRAALAAEQGYDTELWNLLCEQIGVAALGIPEEHDGAGATLFESLLVLEELGRTLTPSPLLSTVLVAEALLAGADDDARTALLPRLAAGEVAAFVDLDSDDPVLDADRASWFVVATGETLGVVEGVDAHATWTPSMDQTLRFGGVRIEPDAVRPIGAAQPARDRIALVGAAATAALAVGCAARGLEMTVEYSRTRVQFGRPIGSFQAQIGRAHV